MHVICKFNMLSSRNVEEVNGCVLRLRKQLMCHDSIIPTVITKGRSNTDMQNLCTFAVHVQESTHDDLPILIFNTHCDPDFLVFFNRFILVSVILYIIILCIYYNNTGTSCVCPFEHCGNGMSYVLSHFLCQLKRES